MSKDKRERIKTKILILLVITCVIQLGIHWNMQAQRFPFHFVSKIFAGNGRSANLDVDSLKKTYFVPETVMVSISSNYWRLDERDSQFHRIWEDIRDNYLPIIIRQKPDKILPNEQWDAITGARYIRIDFEATWPSNVVNWLIEAKPSDTGNFEGIKSIVIAPQLDVNQAVNTLFIYDGYQIYQYQVNIKRDYLPKRYYSSLMDEVSFSNRPSLRLLTSVSNFISDKDIFVALNAGKGSAFSQINAVIPKEIVLNRTNLENYSIQDNILLEEKESLSANYVDSSGYILFTDTENLYRLYNDGVLEYKYLPSVSSGQGNASAAFKQAVTFIEQRKHLVGEARISLNDIKREDTYYVMEFDYKFEGIPVYFVGDKDSMISSPIIIKANSERILECQWVIRHFSKIDKPVYYNIDFPNLLNNQIAFSYPEIIENKDNIFERIEPGYIFERNSPESVVLVPNWIISTNSKNYIIPLLRKEG
ncbi:MAG: hypothetical protein GX022_04375 [Clostridiaceae bacterium]|nr:hypothetical protein [Clostridiaceae bacterium]